MDEATEQRLDAANWAEQIGRQLLFRPLVWLTGALVLAIVLAEQASWLVFVAAELALVTVIMLVSRRHRAQAGLLPLVLLAGGILHALANSAPASDISHWQGSQPVWLTGTVTEVRRTTSGQRITLQLIPGEFPCTGRVVVYDRQPPGTLKPGDVVSAQVEGLQQPESALNPGQFDWRKYLRRQGIGAEARLVSLQVLQRRPSLQQRFQILSQTARDSALRNFHRYTPGPKRELYADLLAGMVYGQRAAGELPPETEDLYRRTGTIHLLVVSGAQVTFIIVSLLLLLTGGLRRLPSTHPFARRWALAPWHLLVIALVLVAFTLLAGLGPSVSRSLVMAGLLVFAMVSGRRYDIATAIALAALALIIPDPNVVFDLGAQLSFAATIGVIIFIPRRTVNEAGVVQRPGLFKQVALGTLGAWIAALPIMAHNFHGVAVLGAVANLIAVPASLLVVPLGMLALVTGSWFPLATRFLCWSGAGLIKLTLVGNTLCAALPGAYVDLVYLSGWGCLRWYTLVGGGLYLLIHARRHPALVQWWQVASHRRWLMVGCVVAVAGLCLWYAGTMWLRPDLRVSFLAVGEGQCVVIESRDAVVMVDAGSSRYRYPDGRKLTERIIVPFLARHSIRRLDALIITHPDADHCNAVPSLLERVKVGTMIDPQLPQQAPSQTYADVVTAARDRGIAVQLARRGAMLVLSDTVTARLLSPREPLLQGTVSDLNNNSVALRLAGPGMSVLLLADLQEAGLQRLLHDSQREGQGLASDLLILPHHGRSLGPLKGLLRAVRPHWCVVSTGALPQQLVDPLRQVQQAGAHVLITNDDYGMVMLSDRWGKVLLVGSWMGARDSSRR